MKRNLKVSKIFFQYQYKPFTYSFPYNSYFTKLPSDLKKPIGRQQRHRPYSVNRGAVEEEKLGEETTTSAIVGSNNILSNNLPHFSLGQQKQSGKEMTVELTNRESKICDLLRKVVAYLKETKQLPSVELRIAGGWVRDKLLGLECHDLDIAIDSLTGFDFAIYMNEFLEKEDKEGILNNQVKIHLIESNPEKSKHLETATTKLFGLDIDFVNLRKEVYEADSRIPVSVENGTPEEDAYRRDITINALFYNIHTYKVEDFTNKGIPDLKEGLIRTPLPAYKTFKDDPLRVLRCIRFASKFRFKIVEDVKNTIIKDESIKAALNEKISRERIGIEINKMIKGPDPVQAIDLVVNLGIYDAVFSPPPQDIIVSGNLGDPKICLITAKILKWLLSDESKDFNVHPIFHGLDENEKRALYLAACTLPYKDMLYTEKKKSQPAYQYVIRESIKV